MREKNSKNPGDWQKTHLSSLTNHADQNVALIEDMRKSR